MNTIWKTENHDSSVGIATDYGVADQYRLIIKDPKRELYGNQPAMYEIMKAFITETSLAEFTIITVQLPT
jgi:hypothetical protein